MTSRTKLSDKGTECKYVFLAVTYVMFLFRHSCLCKVIKLKVITHLSMSIFTSRDIDVSIRTRAGDNSYTCTEPLTEPQAICQNTISKVF